MIGVISIYTIQTDYHFLASNSEPTLLCPAKPNINIDSWLAIARQENIVRLMGVNGYKPNCISRETCNINFIALKEVLYAEKLGFGIKISRVVSTFF